ncbi:MAG: hypothetical protein P1U58_18030 [Verrucomicrobiales bacterium]|nr:hypothetical protein [Verrucomicrobiales bacterium]
MLKPNTVLRRLPKALDPKQVLFLDGIRHASDIATFSYSRLKQTLTEIALQEQQNATAIQSTSAFLDAWSVVDSIDRLRGLFILFPGARKLDGESDKVSLEGVTRPIRNLRNVADHLAERSDYVLAKNGTALGSLAWCTMLPEGDDPRADVVTCAIVPGTVKSGSRPMVNPAGRSLELPTGLITLSAGEFTADLSETMRQMAEFLRDIENQIESFVDTEAGALETSGSDFTVKAYMKLGDSIERG